MYRELFSRKDVLCADWDLLRECDAEAEADDSSTGSKPAFQALTAEKLVLNIRNETSWVAEACLKRLQHSSFNTRDKHNAYFQDALSSMLWVYRNSCQSAIRHR